MSDTSSILIHEGSERTRVSLSALWMGSDLFVRLFNTQEHIGAVALSEYNPEEKRASTSILTRFGHRDDVVAQMAAHKICRHTKIPVCAVAGIHLDNITKDEIEQIVENCSALIDRCIGTINK
jgi:hypothetical protein